MEVITPLLPSSTLTEDKHSTEKLRSSSSSVRIHEIEMANGEFLRLLNVSNSDDYDLSDHFLQQNLRSQILCRYRIPPNTILRAGQTLTVIARHSLVSPFSFLEDLLWNSERCSSSSSVCPSLERTTAMATFISMSNSSSSARWQSLSRLSSLLSTIELI